MFPIIILLDIEKDNEIAIIDIIKLSRLQFSVNVTKTKIPLIKKHSLPKMAYLL